jgi:type IV pilus assembly protein PilM
MPAEVLAEYEAAISAAGYITGAVLPSTLAALAGVEEQKDPVMLVNACRDSVTTAIVREGTLMLHRALDLYSETPEPVPVPAMHGADDMERIEAEIRMESQVLESATREHMNAREIVQAVSVAAAYFEDTLGASPEEMISAGTLGSDWLRALLNSAGMEELKVREAVGVEALAAGTRVARPWLAGVRGALRN